MESVYQTLTCVSQNVKASDHVMVCSITLTEKLPRLVNPSSTGVWGSVAPSSTGVCGSVASSSAGVWGSVAPSSEFESIIMMKIIIHIESSSHISVL